MKNNQFCEILHEHLGDISAKLDTVRANLGKLSQESEEALQTKITSAKVQLEEEKQKTESLKAQFTAWPEAKEAEVKTPIDERKTQRQQGKLTARADNAEDYAIAATYLLLTRLVKPKSQRLKHLKPGL